MKSSKNMANTNLTCEICSKEFSSNRTKKQHITVVHGESKNFLCSVCNKIFGYKNELMVHVENNHQGKHFSSIWNKSEHNLCMEYDRV